MDRDEVKKYLRDIDKQLSEENATGELYIVGGAALALLYNRDRTTYDIDGAFAPYDDIVRLAANTAKKYGLPGDWLNNAVTRLGFDFSQDTECRSYPIGDNFLVTVASPEYLLFLKIHSSRKAPSDIRDIMMLFDLLNVKSENDVYQLTSPFGGINGSLELYVEDLVELFRREHN